MSLLQPFWTPELRAYAELVAKVPEVFCRDCPFWTPKKNKNGGWCKPPGCKERVNFSVKAAEGPHACFTHARPVLKMSV